jgi:predicted dehydrogenase/threonine dehydrogenase-like Zn-dependent dehydrogenase
MKQILQNLKTGVTELVEVPCPQIKSMHLLIQTTRSLISAGTERMLVEFGKASWLAKARQQPDKVKQVIDKIRTDGLMPTIEAVQAKLGQPLPLGYCNVGVVEELGGPSQIQGLKKGDRVVSNGPHAEMVCVPKNLCARIPDGVSDEEAAFTVLGAIGLQGVRLAQPTLGECFVVIGLGLIGLMTIQILQANGCRVLGVDLDSTKCALARQFGAETVDLSQGEDPLLSANSFSRERGVDGVLITAATKSNEPVHQAAEMCRKGGRIVLVGVTGLNLKRDDFYKKELSFQVSCSYGPGRYDPEYEEKGHDYPLGCVRWTEQRNFEAVLDLMATGKLTVKPLISHRYSFTDAEKAYRLINTEAEPYIGIILDYEPGESTAANTVLIPDPAKERTINLLPRMATQAVPVIGFIGAGNFAGLVLLPALQKSGARLKTICSSGGVTGTHLGKKFGFEKSTTDVEAIWGDPEINAVFIATRHDTHAPLVLKGLEAGKHIFVEKPLCLTKDELEEIIKARNSRPAGPDSPLLMVGFNRRFAPQVLKMKKLLEAIPEPKSMIMTVNAGNIPPDHWTQDPKVGGGRIIGEACHFVDLLRFLAGHAIVGFQAAYMGRLDGADPCQDKATLTLSFANGSLGTVHYFANGNKSFPKERLEVFCAGRILQLDNFKALRGYGWKNFSRMRLWRQDKGHRAELLAFLDAITQGGSGPIPFTELVEVTETSIALSGKAGRLYK